MRSAMFLEAFVLISPDLFLTVRLLSSTRTMQIRTQQGALSPGSAAERTGCRNDWMLSEFAALLYGSANDI